MGFLGLIPADKLAATYDPQAQTLILFAEGNARKYTSNISFVQDIQWVGGLKFDLEGWTGPIGSGLQQYNYEQKFPVVLPNAVISGKEIIITTANFPEGKVVTVNWLGFGNDEKSSHLLNAGELSSPENQTPQPPLSMRLPTSEVVVYGESFEIKAGAEAKKGGSVTVKYNSHDLIMTDAKNEDGQIIWTFVSITTGWTQVIMTTILPPPAIGTFKQTYNIEVIGREVSEMPKSITDGKEPGQPAEILSFIGRVFIAERIVKQTWPEAELWEVQCHLPRGVYAPTSNPLDLSQLKAVWNVSKGTVMIDSLGWGTWNRPVFYPYSYGECKIIPFPIKMDIVDAFHILQKAGYKQPFGACTLRHPLGPPDQPWDSQPYYIFELGNFGPMIYVGVDDGSVWPPA